MAVAIATQRDVVVALAIAAELTVQAAAVAGAIAVVVDRDAQARCRRGATQRHVHAQVAARAGGLEAARQRRFHAATGADAVRRRAQPAVVAQAEVGGAAIVAPVVPGPVVCAGAR
ncbi:hypothetical protein G6F68_019134 [Rhizopus microsporus]|nr:hypothetical protein G6F68_019134 [Rhizopus microsporus]